MTIIVLLILAGISIQMLTGDNGILTRAGEAKDKTEQSKIEERRRLASMEAATNLKETVYNDGEKNIKIPSGFAPIGIEGESTVDEGLVITDSQGNEYVWIEVANDGTGPNYTAVESVEKNSLQYYSAIASALREYCKKDLNNENLIKDGTYRDGYNGNTSTYGYKDIWYSDCGIENEQEYIKLYNKMLNSIYENGGFWIGRYEAGIEGSDNETSLARQSHTDITTNSPRVVSKPNCITYNFVSCSEAQKLSSNTINNGTNTSSLMFGIQWDLMLRYLSNKGISTDLITGENSNTTGNNYDNTFIINRGKYSYQDQYNVYLDFKIPTENKVAYQNNVSTKIGVTHEDRILLTTGAAYANCEKNIYDLAGNVSEFTLEKSSLDFMGASTSLRGGCFCSITTIKGAISSRIYYPLNNASYYIGFRVCIF